MEHELRHPTVRTCRAYVSLRVCFYRPDDSVAHVAVIYIQFAQVVSLGAFDTEVAARATIEAVIPLYLLETNL